MMSTLSYFTFLTTNIYSMRLLLLCLFLCSLFFSFKPATKTTTGPIVYSLCEAEFGSCSQKCTIQLIKGDRIAMGSYIKVIFKKGVLTEGYILKHVSGSIFILKNKADANNPEICGSCCGGAYEIDIAHKQILGC